MDVSEELKKQAISFNLCQQWTDDWGKPDMDELVDKYIHGIDFCIKNNYPSNEFIKDNFGEIAERHGVFTDKKDLRIYGFSNVIINGACSGEINLSGFDVSSIYVRHDSNVNIVIKDAAKAIIRVFDNSSVTIDNQAEDRVFVYRYGGKVFSSGNVLVRNRKFEDL